MGNDKNKKQERYSLKEKKTRFPEQKPGDSNKAGKPDDSLKAKEEKESMKNSK